jgi:hypothetical protein
MLAMLARKGARTVRPLSLTSSPMLRRLLRTNQ